MKIATTCTKATTIEENKGHQPLPQVSPKYMTGEKKMAIYPIIIEIAYLKEKPLNIVITIESLLYVQMMLIILRTNEQSNPWNTRRLTLLPSRCTSIPSE